ncbi:ribosome-binding factor A [Chlamydia pecorum MC/MarsBar]|nr:ribosome-binding factor A [Chlamydia pecorum VR629]ETF38027.1 ribosome-binding factor A [Chlamydia pecorum DBDeUG]ETF38295.1 ribosome-binding factor A [Chlamydia pecorum MC/MarsBar]ETF40262.1 ribosome-binding factor A [Chlamydia pecorum IPTaLE]UBV32280.1 ribosome-binding factor A [Chlamydia pecorum]
MRSSITRKNYSLRIMSGNRRIQKVNSLLREAIAEVILKDVQHPKISNHWITVTRVSLSKDLRFAQVYVSIMPQEKVTIQETLEALKVSAGFIACRTSKKVVLKYFPELNFHLEDIFSPQDHIESLLWKIWKEC